MEPDFLEIARRQHAERCRRLGFTAEQTDLYWDGCNQEKLAERARKQAEQSEKVNQ